MDFELILLLTFAEVVMDKTVPDAIKVLRIEALNKLQHSLNHYRHLGFIPRLTSTIAQKKCGWIREATSKTEMQKFLMPRCPRYDGSKFVEDPYIVPEEELICWSYASLRFPLNSIGAARFKELFDRLFPNGVEGGMENDE